MEEHAGHRLRRAMTAAKVSNSQLAEAAGVSVQAVGKWLRKGTIARERLAAITAALGVSADALVGNETTATLQEPRSFYPIADWAEPSDLHPDRFRLVPRLEVALSMGQGRGVPETIEERQGLAFQVAWLKRLGVSPERLRVFPARGNSMEPTISDGSVVLVDTGSTEVISGKVFVVEIDHEPRLKRLFKRPNGMIQVVSDNESDRANRAFDAAPDDLRIFGRAVWHGGLL